MYKICEMQKSIANDLNGTKEDDMEKIIFNNLKELKLKINYFMNILG